ncbi:MAG: branched-chain amino acid ABC transporter permease [Betaproteobacteria bacterium HGW-Betaproteobacteria-13]|jgi:branched-chain amino acid transport system permease protein|nr:MAG: branched-chain amino acid ABC transporter permease [Betaproteobacteria bacterium HGW-Betaproteobacteria-19]PKO81526.1 MAG: branched-chain amino acid ABC transporter permease [Betaproteobacteria bacterium HGW-Betaproteobacteria-13]
MLSLIQVLTSGIAIGCVYGLVALSFVLIYKATETVSFMQGELLMVGAFAAVALNTGAGWPLWLAAVVAVAGLALLGAVLERVALRRAIGQPHLVAVLLTFGLGMMLRGGVTSVPAASHDIYRLPFADSVLQIGALALSLSHVLVIVATVVLAGMLAVFFRYTRAGLALRACSENARVAALMGVPVASMHTLAWALGAALAAGAGLLLAPITFIHLNMGLIALKAFPAAVLGGLTSLPGALVGGVFLGVAESLAGLVLPEGVKDVVPYVLLMLALLLFPDGMAAGWRRRR